MRHPVVGVGVDVDVVVVEDDRTYWGEVEDPVGAGVVGDEGEDAVVDEAAVKGQDVFEQKLDIVMGAVLGNERYPPIVNDIVQ